MAPRSCLSLAICGTQSFAPTGSRAATSTRCPLMPMVSPPTPCGARSSRPPAAAMPMASRRWTSCQALTPITCWPCLATPPRPSWMRSTPTCSLLADPAATWARPCWWPVALNTPSPHRSAARPHRHGTRPHLRRSMSFSAASAAITASAGCGLMAARCWVSRVLSAPTSLASACRSPSLSRATCAAGRNTAAVPGWRSPITPTTSPRRPTTSG